MKYKNVMLLVAILITACSPVFAQVRELPLPVVPDSIRVPADRAGYVMSHFWDSMDFSDSAIIADDAFMEQNFVNYLSLIPHADNDKLPDIINDFLHKAEENRDAYEIIYRLAGVYLNNLDSPMRDEGAYIIFLNHAVGSSQLGEAEKERARFRLEMAMKNRPGDPAPDFRLVTREGKETSLTESLRDGINIVLFYDPDCNHCADVISAIAADAALGKANILAVDSEDDRQLWQQTAGLLPDSWTVGFALDAIQDDEVYVFPEMPSIYVIDSKGVIILKEATVADIQDLSMKF